ncbi:alpha/beta hydrolase [Rhizobium sp. VS19-DR104.2]|uniref:alpha/beta fold hydrolase n=1 Tax=unclassified Rhizobium TaxID=2613769 RepID=UPI001CC71759|nr:MULTISPECIES: alpha/beta hydrolase [unclassified Rhizobium]MBZ5762300.1 alpha/beta hydrolase [Rhizobium sp. VS19-DR96]MBZ5768316.1 alpha/beta hydrolase [Rhizobium sp. VS19-DR129.2]MBZ5775812.1 alpha/beta hydrolase [Rhizobium sp. VS19-DRK62.2]MBZ5787167.1 alpha/beta hydrolase [Rhizobium sp. VS19-DR121]MBZ5804242.1 alpha/beta hydrolase [Rhizobium sp. VS19-DR181]
MSQKLIETSHGAIALDDNGGDGVPLLMLHANSCCKEEFVFQTRALDDKRRVIALDFPGHGASSDAIDARRTYNISGYADAVLEVLDKLGVGRFAVLGHSLGGHVSLELIARGGNVAGAMIFGTPPIPNSLEGLQLGFIPSPEMAYTGNPVLTEEEARGVVRLALGLSAERDIFYTSAVQRTDGRARQYMLEAVMDGQDGDQREVVATSTVPLAVVNGADDPVVNLDYVDSLNYRNLWTPLPLRVADAGHGVHWQQHAVFNELLQGFLQTLD